VGCSPDRGRPRQPQSGPGSAWWFTGPHPRPKPGLEAMARVVNRFATPTASGKGADSLRRSVPFKG